MHLIKQIPTVEKCDSVILQYNMKGNKNLSLTEEN